MNQDGLAACSNRPCLRNIRLDRAWGLVTQTEMPLAEVAVASGSDQVHFSRAYRERFGMAPRRDRLEGRIPFESRTWPLQPAAPAISRAARRPGVKKVDK